MKTNKGLHQGLLKTAEDLLNANKTRPNEAHLRRAVSSVYYALFHYLAKECADNFIGTSTVKNRSNKAWQQVYRALDHGTAKNACEAAKNKNFPPEIKAYAVLFIEAQEKRHQADYDPFANTAASDFTKENIMNLRERASSAIDDLDRLSKRNPADMKAFSAFVLIKKRNN